MDMQAVILAGGVATRLGDLTRNQPKSMLKIEGRAFLEYQLELLKKGNIVDVVLCVGHLADQIIKYFGNGKRYGINIKYSVEDRPLGTAGALRKAEYLLNETFFTIYGDSYLFLDFPAIRRYFESQNKLALMTVYKNYDYYDRSNVVVDGNMVLNYNKRERPENAVYIDYGAHILKKETLKIVPVNQFYGLEDLFPHLIAMKELLAFEVKERFYEIGSPQGLKEFEQYAKEMQ